MSDSVLTVLKFCLVALLYLFLMRVVWVVTRELRGTPAPQVAVPAPAPAAPAAPKARRKGWRLVVAQPAAEKGHAFDVDREVTIGRGGGCTVPLTFDTFVSQVHARVYERDGRLWLEDLGSTNGTFVNGKQVQEPVMLRRGDRVQVGETVLEAER
jgi:hypothetical protein